MDIQFLHKHHTGRPQKKKTYAVLLPNAVDFSEMLENPERQITLAVGIAVCSPKDNYSKKIGRELSSSRVQPVTFRLHTMTFYPGQVYFTLLTEGGNQFLQIRMNEKSPRLHLLDAYSGY